MQHHEGAGDGVAKGADAAVDMPDAGATPLVGHFLRAVVAGNLAAGARMPRGCVGLRIGEMALTLVGDGQRVAIRPGLLPEAGVVLSAELDALLRVALGNSPLLPVLAGRMRIRGNPLLLLRWLPVLRAPEASP